MKIVTAFEIAIWKRVVYARVNTDTQAEKKLKEVSSNGHYIFPRIEDVLPDKK